MLDTLAPSFSHAFAGEHALAGVRRTRASQAAWFERLFRLLPDVMFTVRDVLVTGWPWRTTVVALVDVRLADDATYRNQLVQVIELRWGRITAIANHEDSQALAALLERRARAGIAEALAAPITDADVASAAVAGERATSV